MALRSPSKLLIHGWRKHFNASHIHWGKTLLKSQETASAHSDQHASPTAAEDNELDLTFSDPKAAYASKSNSELFRALFVFNLCSVETLVEHNRKVLKLARKLMGRRLFCWMMRSTMYGHFVAGEDQEDIKPLIWRNRRFGVKSILDYSVEKDISEDEAVEKVKDSSTGEPHKSTRSDTDGKTRDGLEEVVENPLPRSDASMKKFQTSLDFANRSDKVVSARTYFYESENQCDENMQTFLNCIDAVSDSTNKEGFAAIKLTALGRPQLLLQMSDFLLQLQNLFVLLARPDTANLPVYMRTIDKESFQERLQKLGVDISYDEQRNWFTLVDVQGDGEIDLLDWSHMLEFENNLANIFCVRNTKTGQQEQIVPPLSQEGLGEMRNMVNRINTIATHAKEKSVRVMVDAEQSYFQPAIRRIVMEMMRVFNKDSAVIFNTYQCYLKDALNQVQHDLHFAERDDFYFGAKLVRGAYMEQERERASLLGYEDPINADFEATTAMYESALEAVFQAINRRPKGRVAVMVASHNEETVRNTVIKMKEHKVLASDRVICFGQLLGMCDQISFALGGAGYSVYKYVPYGPVEEVLPYLSRRATENRGILDKVVKERRLLWSEVGRRLKSGNLFYKSSLHEPNLPLPIPPEYGGKKVSSA